MAQVGAERLEEIADPELAFQRAVSTYREKGYSDEWINQRLRSIDIRNELTSEWNRVGVNEGKEYAILTNEITKAWSGMTTKEYKQYKGLKKEGLRDNMTNLELVLNMLAEASTTAISKNENPDDFEESKSIAKRGGSVAGNARKDLEENLGRQIVSKQSSKNPKLLDDT